MENYTNNNDDYYRLRQIGCNCGCGPHCGHSCMTDGCDCTECNCLECRTAQAPRSIDNKDRTE